MSSPRLPVLDRLLVALGTALLVGGVVVGAVRAAPPERPTLAALVAANTAPPASPTRSDTEPSRADTERPRADPDLVAAGGPGAGPLRDRLPAGVRIDPDTLELVGFELEPDEGSEAVDWRQLGAYVYREGLEGLPEELRALDGTSVTMAGFLLPLYEFDDIREFNLVASHWSCCFGVPPGINGWVHVRLGPDHPGLRNSTEPLRVVGTFRVREQKEAGYVVSIYALEDAEARVVGW